MQRAFKDYGADHADNEYIPAAYAKLVSLS